MVENQQPDDHGEPDLTGDRLGAVIRGAKEMALAAEQRAAWGEAAEHYERCLSLISDSSEGHDEDEAPLLMTLGICHRNANAQRAAWRSFMRSVALYKEREDGIGLARVALEATGVSAPQKRLISLVQESLTLLGNADLYLEAKLRSWLATSALTREERSRHASAATALAEEQGFEDVRVGLLRTSARSALEAGNYADAERLLSEAQLGFENLGLRPEAARAASARVSAFISSGELRRAREAVEFVIEYSGRDGLQVVQHGAFGQLANIALLQRRFDEFKALSKECPARSTPMFDMLRSLHGLVIGDEETALHLPTPDPTGGEPMSASIWMGFQARTYIAFGYVEQAQHAFQLLRDAMPTLPGSLEHEGRWVHPAPISALDDALFQLADEAYLLAVFETLRRTPPVFFSAQAHSGSMLLLQGRLALIAGETKEAEWTLRGMLEVAIREGSEIVAGRCEQGLAEVAVQQGSIPTAVEYLDSARLKFERQGARFYVDQAAARKLELRKA